jgi:Tol biopolymer transport system component
MDTPPRIRTLLQRCLAKEPDRRLHDIADARIDIEDALAGREWETAASAGVAGATRRRPWRALALVAAGLLVGALASTILRQSLSPGSPWSFGSSSPTAVTRLSLVAPPGMGPYAPRITPDGTTVAYYAEAEETGGARGALPTGLYMSRLNRFESELVQAGSMLKVFSPDGRWLAYVAPVATGSEKQQLMKRPLDASSPPLPIADWPSGMQQCCMEWLPSGEIVGLTQLREGKQALLRFPADGSAAPPAVEIVWQGAGSNLFVTPSHFPDGRYLLAVGASRGEQGERWGTALVNVETGEARFLFEEGVGAVWVPTRHLLFTRSDTLLAVPFDLGRLQTAGPPVTLLDGLSTAGMPGGAYFDVSANGTLVYRPGGNYGAGRTVVTLTRDLQIDTWSEHHEPPVSRHVTVSDDGRRLAVVLVNRHNWEIWISPFDRPRLRRIVADDKGGQDSTDPVWSPDGQSLVYLHWGNGIFKRDVDGDEEPELLLKRVGFPQSFTPDGSQLLVNLEGEIVLVPLDPGPDGERVPRTITKGESGGRPFSPDGRWIAYTSRESGRPEVYVREFRVDGSLGPKIQVSSEGGAQAAWSRREMALTYVTPTRDLMMVSVESEPRLVVSEPRLLANLSELHLEDIEPLPDGGWIAVRQGPEEYETQEIHVVQNWFVELERKLATSR